MKRIQNKQTVSQVGKKVKLCGWVNARRNMGQIVFLDLRDRSGLIQVVASPSDLDEQSRRFMGEIKQEFVVEIEGKVKARPQKQINNELVTGTVEIEAEKISILNPAKILPFEISSEDRQANEKLRLKYRYLDLRHQRLKNNLILRAKIINFFRQWLNRHEFVEIETPFLTKGTPEGAREYIVPARLYPGEFYVLPQSPQQFKQLLMVAGMERYYQVAKCFRDEDTRGDRQPEFTQLDMEMSFVEEEDLLQLIEEMFINLIKQVAPEKKIKQLPFPQLTFAQAMEQYHSDKPDLRKDKQNDDELAFCWITDIPLFEYSEEEKKLVSVHHPFTSPKDEDLKLLDKKPEQAKAKAYDLVLNGYEIAGGSIRIHQPELQKKIFKILQLKEKETKERFGHLLEAFQYGAPPHGGIAVGLDRLIMILAKELNIREVIAFPKTSDGRDLMMDSPSKLPEQRLTEAHIKVIKKKSK